MVKYLITGCAGLIGSSLAQRLYKEGHELVLIDNLSHGYVKNLIIDNKLPGEFHALDIRSKEIYKLFEGVDCVFHLAAISSLPECQSNPGEAMSVNVAGTANVLEAARRAKVRRVIFASTSAIYENNTKFPCKEEDEVSPIIIYSLSKWMGEKLCNAFIKSYGMEITITRYYNVYGPHQDIKRKHPAFVGYAIREALAKRTPVFHSDGEQKRDYVYLDDVNELNILCATHPKAANNIFNVCSGRPYSVKEIYSIIKKIIKGAPEPKYQKANKFWEKYSELKLGYALNDKMVEKEVNKFTLGSTKKAEKILKWKAKVSIDEGMKKTMDYFKSSK